MEERLLSELIERTREAIRSFEYSQSTFYQYELVWKGLSNYFMERHQALFSKPLAQQYLLESRAKWETGLIKSWRYKLDRRAIQKLIEWNETGWIKRKVCVEDRPLHLQQGAYILLNQEYLNFLKETGKKIGTIQVYGLVSRQFLEYLEERKIQCFANVGGKQVSAFIPLIAKEYQPGSMRTVLSALRCFLRFVESQKLSDAHLSRVIPSSIGRVSRVYPTITIEEEQKLLDSIDRTTPLGKRNYAMLLLALRTGLRSMNITNLKLNDINWRRNTIEIVQAKTGTPLVLPLLADVGNAIAEYILNGRPASQEAYIFLRIQAPYRKLSSCYGISCKLMKEAGLRQGPKERKGFHGLRHSLAARLLAAETPLPIISSILGHQNKDSAKVYLSSDLLHLRACALDLRGIEVTQEELR